MKKALVTGADGFIGSHLVEMLTTRGVSVRAFSMYNSFGTRGWLDDLDPKILSEIEIFTGDIRDAAAVRSAVSGCDTVLHLAALIGIPYSYVAPESYIDTNIKGTLNVLLAAREQSVDRIVCTSTSEVYGSAQVVPITEDHPLVGQSPYSASKIGADQLALSFHYSFGLPVVVARPFNTYGPRQSVRAVIPTVITQIAAGREEVHLGSVTPTRDFNFVTDTAAGLIACAETSGCVGETINLGSGYEISIGETVALIADVMGASVRVVSAKERLRPMHSEVQRLCADGSKAERLLNWRSRYAGRAGLRDGLKATAEWFSRPENLSKFNVAGYTV